MSVPTFPELVSSIHGRGPFRWQERAAAELAATGWWTALRAPTGTGKTTLIECWLHALAVSGPEDLGRRLVWVVDRRSVVDQVYTHAKKLIAALPETVVAPLTAIGGGVAPRAVLWRGGLDDEASIDMRTPLQPAQVAVVVSTVDQLGSRLLFRGYGLRNGSRSLHAGLLGVDTTVVLDEAQLSEPLRATVERVADIQERASHSPRPPIRICPISATHEANGAFELTAEERDEPPIRRILDASKRARLDTSRPSAIPALVDELVERGANVVGVVLNTVAEARHAYERLAAYERILVIGPVRPLDRLDPVEEVLARKGREGTFVVVATQTIEVGVDLDFDALITACAPHDSLVQRFGRLDRRGERQHSEAVVLAPPARGCPVYGDASKATWDWLNTIAGDGMVVDFGISAFEADCTRIAPPPAHQRVDCVTLLDAHVDALSVTDAQDDEGPAVELFLHGAQRPSRDVSVAWRVLPDKPEPADVERDLTNRPLHSEELLTLSASALRRWVAGEDAPALSDIDSTDDDQEASFRTVRRAWRVDLQAGKVERVARPSDIRPGDRVVIAAATGGLDEFGWAPNRTRPVVDLGSLPARGARVVLDAADELVAPVAAELLAGGVTGREAAALLADAITAALPEPTDRERFAQRVAGCRDELRDGEAALLDDGRVLVVGKRARTALAGEGKTVTLDVHQRLVRDRVAQSTDALGLGAAVVRSLARAARHHDEGKRDPRFQEWLRGGRAVPGVLAKSAYPYNPRRVQRLREAAGWPKDKRHELLAAIALAEAFPDDPLAWWGGLTHHGHHRPFPVAVEDDCDDPVDLIVDGRSIPVPANALPGVELLLQTFRELSSAHGPWGLAFLEAVLVSADRAVSAEGK